MFELFNKDALILLLVMVAIVLLFLVMAAFLLTIEWLKTKSYVMRRGYTLRRRDEFGLLELCKDFRLFKNAGGGKITLQIFGEHKDFRFCFYNYKVRRASGWNIIGYNYISFGLVFISKVKIPGTICLDPLQSIQHQGLSFGGFSEVKLPNDEFNKKYAVSASDPKLAQEFFSPELMEYILGMWGEIYLDVSGNVFLMSVVKRLNKRIIILEDYDTLLETANSILSHLPQEFVTKHSCIFPDLTPEVTGSKKRLGM